ncbi:MAG: heavy-metal-associated domain-containing protein [Marinifilaceae bacterium]
MKTITQILKKATMAIAIILFTTAAYAQKQDVKKVETVTFNVELDCQGCVRKIEKNLPFEKGVKDLKVDFKKQKVTVTYKTKATNSENLEKAIKKLGFKVEKEEKK